MSVKVNTGQIIDDKFFENYFNALVNSFFKILPMKENNEQTIVTYMESLKMELIGCKGLVNLLNDDPTFVTLLSILENLIENIEQMTNKEVKREVFRSISLSKRMSQQFCGVTK